MISSRTGTIPGLFGVNGKSAGGAFRGSGADRIMYEETAGRPGTMEGLGQVVTDVGSARGNSLLRTQLGVLRQQFFALQRENTALRAKLAQAEQSLTTAAAAGVR